MNARTSPLAPLVDAIVAARCSATPARADAALVPASHVVAYATQQAVTDALGLIIGGWKVGMLTDGTPTSAPMYAHDILASGASWRLPASGTLVVEIELAMRMSHDLPARPGRAYTRDEVAAAIGEVLVGIELLKSRFEGDAFPAPAVHLADNLGNLGYITGGATHNFATLDLARLMCRYALDGVEAHAAIGGHPQDDPWRPLLACLYAGTLGASGLRAGQLVTTGTLVIPFRISEPVRLTAALDGIGSVSVDFVR